jgi:four helix bundle protein
LKPVLMNDQAAMCNDKGEAGGRRYDLEERSARFGEAVIALCKRVQVNAITTPIVQQLVRAATSIGANYCEADSADSRKEFRYRISVCNRESKESKHHIRMLVAAEPQFRDAGRPLWQEAKELNLIFAAILQRLRER